MKRNLTIIGYDYQVMQKLAVELADMFCLREYNIRQIFNFDIAPFSFEEIYEKMGKDFVDSKIRGLVLDECDYDKSIMILEPAIVKNLTEKFNKLQDNNLILHIVSNNYKNLCQRELGNHEKSYYELTDTEILNTKQIISSDLADITIDVSGLEGDEIIEKVLQCMKEFYGL